MAGLTTACIRCSLLWVLSVHSFSAVEASESREPRPARLYRTGSSGDGARLRKAPGFSPRPVPQVTGEWGAVNGTALLEQLITHLGKPDPAFGWTDTGARLSGSITVDSATVEWTGYVLNVTSQTYLAPGMASRSVWWHPMVVVVPLGHPGGDLSPDQVLFYTGGAGLSNDGMHDPASITTDIEDVQAAVDIAANSGMISVALLQVPNQPIVFADDADQVPRFEDAWKAFSNALYVNSPLPAAEKFDLLPDVATMKAVLRSMDALQAFSEQELPGGRIESFFLTGCSKRGQASWTAAAFDARISGLLPCALPPRADFIISEVEYAAYGAYTYSLKDYVQQWVNNPDFKTTLSGNESQIVSDVYNFFSAFTMPVNVLLSNDDEFFYTTSSSFFFSELPGPKHLLQLPNTRHVGTLSMGNFIPAMIPWLRANGKGQSLPQISWTIDNSTGAILVQQVSPHTPTQVLLWSSHSCAAQPRKDFRFMNLDHGGDCWSCGFPTGLSMPSCINTAVVWQSTELQETSPGSGMWLAQVPEPADGSYTAFMVAFEYDMGDFWPFLQTTEASIVPLTWPYSPCPPPGICLGDPDADELPLALAERQAGRKERKDFPYRDLPPMWPHWNVPSAP